MHSSTFPDSRADAAGRPDHRPVASLAPIYAALLALVAAGVLALVVGLWPAEGVHPPLRRDLRTDPTAQPLGGAGAEAAARPVPRTRGERLRRAGLGRVLA